MLLLANLLGMIAIINIKGLWIKNIGINFKIAIYTGLSLAIFFSFFPIIFKRRNFKEFLENFFMLLIGITFLVFMITL